MPAGFQLINPDAEVWIRQPDQGLRDGWRSPKRIFTVVGRLRPGVTLQQAQSELSSLEPKLAEQMPEVHRGWAMKLETLQDVYVGRIRRLLLVFQGAVFFLLIIACANVAGLLLAEAVTGRKELAIRAAIGSDRWCIIRQLIVETLLLSLIAGLTGLCLAWAGLRVFVGLAPHDFPRVNEIGIDLPVFGFALLLSLLTGLLFGTLPSMQV